MKTSFLLIGLAAAALTAPARADEASVPPNPLIVGGTPVDEISEIPWQVALVSGGAARNQFCGGSIVADDWVLTAAHCVDNRSVGNDPTRLEVVAGTVFYATGGEQMAVSEIHVHPDWNSATMDFDAALLRLSAPLTEGAPILLASAEEMPGDGVQVRVSGWGAISEGGPGSDQLLFAEPPVVTNAVCDEPESYDGGILASMFCAGAREGGLDACQGDSGGPVDTGGAVTADTRLLGIVSWGIGCARELKYGVYTRVSEVADWAHGVMGVSEDMGEPEEMGAPEDMPENMGEPEGATAR